MGEIHVHEFMTLDGVVDNPAWTFEYGFDPQMGETLAALTARSGGILLGRATYEMFEPAWSTRTVEEAMSTAAAAGDFDYGNVQHHGTPDERRAAWLDGFRSGDPAVCARYVPA